VLYVRSVLFLIIFFAVLYPLLTLACVFIFTTPRSFYVKMPYYWSGCLLWVLRVVAGIRYEVRGQENMIPGQTVLCVSKHQSAWETLAFNYLFRDPCYVVKRETLFLPPFGCFLAALNMIPIKREEGLKSLRQMVQKAKSIIPSGRPIIIYPEGTRTKAGVRSTYKNGVYLLYQQCNIPVVPIALNSGCFWAKHSLIKHPGTVVLEFFPAIAPGLDKDTFMQRLESTIEDASQALYEEALHA